MRTLRRRSVAWLAILLVGLNALWPLIAQARPKAPGILVPVCTIEGITHYAELPAPKAPLEQRSDASHEHCKICLFGLERASLPSAAPQVAAAADRDIATLPAAVAAADSSFHSLARPRAPPAFS